MEAPAKLKPPRYEPVPEAELTATIGSFKVTPSGLKAFQHTLYHPTRACLARIRQRRVPTVPADPKAGPKEDEICTFNNRELPAVGADQQTSSTPRKRRGREPYPDPEKLLAGKVSVTYKTAAELLGVSDRHVRKLVANGELVAIGRGQNKKIAAANLKVYAGLSVEKSGTKRNKTE